MVAERSSFRQRPRQRQRGAALLMAMIIVTLIATLASAMVWQQWRAVQVEAAERARTQSAWILAGALDWARLILREDLRASPASGPVDHLGEPWATPLAEARLSTFLAADKDNTDDGPEAFLSGTITDAQARYNLRRLIGADGAPVKDEVATLQRLCESVGLSGQVATQITNGMRDALATTPAAGAPLMPISVDQLSWFGIDGGSLAALAPYIVVLPSNTPTLNVNTASREVLAAVVPGMDLATSERLVQLRQHTPFTTPAAFEDQVKPLTVPAGAISVSTEFFEVRGRLRLSDHVLEQRSLVQRFPATGQVSVIRTERVASSDPANP
jgi:general secretion pathway protein K